MRHLNCFWAYYGSKWSMSKLYPAPRHRTVIEPFAGSAGYSMRHHGRDVVLVEKDPDIAALWDFLIHVSADEVRRIPTFPVGTDIREVDLPKPWNLLISWTLAPGAAQRQYIINDWGRQYGIFHQYNSWTPERRERIASQVDAIRHWKIIEGDYTDAPDVEAAWFIDPPYAGAPGSRYRHNTIDYDQLGDWCKSRSGAVIVCESEGADWLPFEPLASVRNQRRGLTAEVAYIQGVPYGEKFLRSPIQKSLFEEALP